MLFIVVAVAQHFYVRYKLNEATDRELTDWAKQLIAEIAYKGEWDLYGFRHGITDCDTCYVITRDGLLIEVEQPIPHLIGPARPAEGFTFDTPATVGTKVGESWRLLGKKYEGGAVIVGIESSKLPDLSKLDRELSDNLDRFGSTLQSAARTGARSTDFEVAYMVVDGDGDILNSIGGVPMFVDPASLPVAVGQTRLFSFESGNRSYRIYSGPLAADLAQPVGTILVGKEITLALAGVADQDRFNAALVGVVIAITGLAAFIFATKRVRRRRPIAIEEALLVGESKTVEFKSTYYWDASKGKNNDECRLNVLRAIAGFLNADGGTLFIGVAQNNTGENSVCGIAGDLNTSNGDRDALRLKLASQVAERIGSPFSRFVTDRIDEVEGRSVWIVEVEPANEPAWVRWDNRRRYFIREGPRTSELDSESTYRYIKNKWG